MCPFTLCLMDHFLTQRPLKNAVLMGACGYSVPCNVSWMEINDLSTSGVILSIIMKGCFMISWGSETWDQARKSGDGNKATGK